MSVTMGVLKETARGENRVAVVPEVATRFVALGARLLVTRWILGIRLSFEGMVIDPCVPAHWKEFQVVRQWRGATFNITVSNPGGLEKGVKSVTLNGRPIQGAIPPQPAGSVNEVRVVMG